MLRRRRGTILVLAVLCLSFISATAAADEPAIESEGVDIVGTAVFEPMLLLPAALGLLGALLLWRWLLPSSLSNLQVAFEVDENLYEVHRLTKSRKDALRIIARPAVIVGVLLYLMAMSGVVIILAEVVDDALIWNRKPTWFMPTMILTGLLLIIPITLSPFITLFAQLSPKAGGEGRRRGGKSRLFYVGITITIVLGSLAPVGYLAYYDMLSVDDEQIDEMKLRWADDRGPFSLSVARVEFACVDNRPGTTALPYIPDISTEAECLELIFEERNPATEEIETIFYGSWMSNNEIYNMRAAVQASEWIGLGLLVFMFPTIAAYGRIMGASWNMIIIQKWRTMRGVENPIDPDKASIFGRFAAGMIILVLATMPIAALNGIATLVWVRLEEPVNQKYILDLGGIIGNSLLVFVSGNSILRQLIDLKNLSIVLAGYLMLNVSVVGLALIFEMIRNLFLGGQSIGGNGGVILGQAREIRSEERVQSRLLSFGLAGFAGYSVLLLVLQVYKEWGEQMPFVSSNPWMTPDHIEFVLLQETWNFIAAGQAIFLLTWLVSITRFFRVKRAGFDLSPDERREGDVNTDSGHHLRKFVEDAARKEDVAALRRFQFEKIPGDEGLVRLEKMRAAMLEYAIRGLWPMSVERARTLLAQQGGNDDHARMVIAVGHIANRRLDAAREAISGLMQDDEFNEPELIEFCTEWFDPWNGAVEEDDLYDWEHESGIDLIKELQSRLSSWDPTSEIGHSHKGRLAHVGLISSVAMLRAQRRSDEGLDLSLGLIRRQPSSIRARIAASLCLIDLGEWHDALDIFEELIEHAPEDPRVQALGGILGFKTDTTEFESSVLIGTAADRKEWLDQAPVNPYVGLSLRGGMDEALNANVMVIAHEALERGVPSSFSHSPLHHLFNWLILMPLWALAGFLIFQRTGSITYSVSGFIILLIVQIFWRRFQRQQRRVIRHRDQKAMLAYSKRLRRHRVIGDPDRIPIGNSLLLSGILLDINGVILDIGFPGWLTIRNERQRSKTWRQLMHGRVTAMRRAKLPRTKPLPNEWWRKRPKPYEMEGRVLERLIGPAAYRGMTRMRLQDIQPNERLVQQRKQQQARGQQSGYSQDHGFSDSNRGGRGAPAVQQRGGGTGGGDGSNEVRRGAVTQPKPRNTGVTVRQRQKR
jgi:hypothetical protein